MICWLFTAFKATAPAAWTSGYEGEGASCLGPMVLGFKVEALLET